MRSRTQRIAATAVGLALFAGPLGAAEFTDPEWPCIQRKVPELAVFQMWSGPMPAEDWREDTEIVALAQRLAQRRVSVEAAEAAAASFVEGMPEEARGQTLANLFAGVLAQINVERSQVISGIGRYALRQTDMTERIDGMQQDLVALEAVPEEQRDWDRIEELRDRLAWETRVYKERAQSLTYVCETPVLLEQRAFAIGRALAGLI